MPLVITAFALFFILLAINVWAGLGYFLAWVAFAAVLAILDSLRSRGQSTD